jgi:WS/DGAT/MGAT family acyltransferase
MPHMTPMDRAFFLLETEQRPMNVGALFVLSPPKARRNFGDALVERMLRCPVGAPFTHRLVREPIAGWPMLVDDPRIDASRQVFRHRLPPGSDRQKLFEHICAIHTECLDRSRPLWEAHVFEGLADDRLALYFKTHHGLIDGLGFIRVLLGAVSRTPGARQPRALWSGLPNGGASTKKDAALGPLRASAIRPRNTPPARPASNADDVASLLRKGLRFGRTATDLARLAWHAGRRDFGLGEGMALPFVGTPHVFKAPPSRHRVMGHCALPLARVRSIARAADAKVNDVLLATLDLAMCRYLDERGTPASRPLVADMPVALHDDDGKAGNRITILQVPLGRPGGTPVERLADIVRETRQVKQEVRTLDADALFLYSILAHSVASAIESLNLGELPMLANAVISNPTGLTHTVYFNGAEVELALPVSVVAHHQVLNVTISNYGSQLHVTFIAVRDALPDVQHLADGTVAALERLHRSVGRRKH